MAHKSARDAARDEVAAYHEACLLELIHRVGVAVDRARSGDISSFEADQSLFQYSRAAKDLWKFCNVSSDAEFTASLIRDSGPIDWWERGAPKRR